jgi:ABC-type nitrate/sulfonate/bicarbonate transport system permease component
MDASWRMALTATRHCLTGCAIGEVAGMLLSTWWGWGNAGSIVLSVVLAFLFGYLLTYTGVRRAGADSRTAARAALASDTVSILTMEIVDNVFLLVVPGAMAATLDTSLFWWSLAVSLAVAFAAAVPVNHWLMARGRGHAVVHRFHEEHAGHH